MPTLARVFGIIDDGVSGGSEYDTIKWSTPTIPDATTFWPVTGGTFDAGIERIDRNAEVRGRRANTAPAPFRAAPTITVPVMAYRTVIEKSLYKLLGQKTTTGGTGSTPYTHAFTAVGFGNINLPAAHVQLVRDDLNIKMAGGTWNRITFDFPLDGEGTVEMEVFGKWHSEYVSAAPTATYTTPADVLMLRDATAYLDGTTPVNEVQTISITGTATGGTFTVVFTPPSGAPAETTTAISFNGTAANVQTALESVPSIDPGDVVVTGGPLPATPVTITFTGELAGMNIASLSLGTNSLTGTVPVPTFATTTPGVGYGSAVLDLQGFSLTFTNNLVRKWYAGRNVQTRLLNTQTKKLWFPAENKAQAAADVTYTINFGNTVTAQEVADWFAQVQKIVFNVVGGPLGGAFSGFSEVLRFTLYNTVNTGGGADALTSREDITSSFEGGVFYSAADGGDLKIEVVTDTPTVS